MRPVLWILVCSGAVASARSAAASPPTGWQDVPALITAAMAPHDAALRACTKPPHQISLTVTRTRDGGAQVGMPLPGLGIRGPTAEERCLSGVVAKIVVPALPAEIESVILGYTITAANAPVGSPDPAFEDWRDPAATLAALIDAKRRAALAACDAKRRVVRVVLDLRAGATRAWLPAWQFHAANGDGTTPPAQRRVKACLTKALRDWKPRPLPGVMGELQLAISPGG